MLWVKPPGWTAPWDALLEPGQCHSLSQLGGFHGGTREGGHGEQPLICARSLSESLASCEYPGFLLQLSLLCVGTGGCNVRIQTLQTWPLSSQHGPQTCGLSSTTGEIFWGPRSWIEYSCVWHFWNSHRKGRVLPACATLNTGSQAPSGHWPYQSTTIWTLEFCGEDSGLTYMPGSELPYLSQTVLCTQVQG